MSANGVSGPHGYDRTESDRSDINALTAASSGAKSGGATTGSLGSMSFSDVLRAINPLQYLPVVGTIYRAVTGDVAPEGLRTAVSLMAGVITGGPVGAITSIISSIAENMFHLDDHARQAVTALTGAPGGQNAHSPATTTSAGDSPATPDASSVTPSDATRRAVAAYASSGLLGSV